MMTERLEKGLQFALYIRDALALVDSAPDAVPLLEPAVPVQRPSPVGGDDLRAWRAWFASLLSDVGSGVPNDPLGRLLISGPTPALGAAASTLEDDANEWIGQRAVEHIEREDNGRRLALNRVVAEIEEEMGRAAAPFTLHLVVLPVVGMWERWARRDLMLFSEGSRNDMARVRDALGPVVRELS
jgi:hypothetical protein